MRTLIWMLIAIPIVLYLVACGLFYSGQHRMMYIPTQESRRAIAEELRLEANGETLKIWHRRRPGSQAVLYFGGNAEDVARSIASLRTAFSDHSLFLMNYRGYGGSTGEASEEATARKSRGVRDTTLGVFHFCFLPVHLYGCVRIDCMTPGGKR